MPEPIDTFASTAQMAERSNGAIPADRPFLDSALKAATKRIRNFCGWHIATEQQDTLVLDGQAAAVIYLPTLRVVSIDEVTIDGTEVVFESDSLQWSQEGKLWRPSWSVNYRGVQLKYTHGFAEVPDDLVDMTLLIASRDLGSPLGVVREQTLSSSVTWSQTGFNQAGGANLLDSEKDALQAYKLGYIP